MEINYGVVAKMLSTAKMKAKYATGVEKAWHEGGIAYIQEVLDKAVLEK
jgi:hypothetical protein